MSHVHLLIPFEFDALHSLPVRPQLHAHRYRIVLEVSGPVDPASGFVLNMELLRKEIDPDIQALQGASLNGHAIFEAEGNAGALTSKLPTCELMAQCFAQRYRSVVDAIAPSAKLAALEVHLVNRANAKVDEFEEFGAARCVL